MGLEWQSSVKEGPHNIWGVGETDGERPLNSQILMGTIELEVWA